MSEPQLWQSDLFLSKGTHVNNITTAFVEDRGLNALALDIGMSSLDYTLKLKNVSSIEKDWDGFALIS